MTVDPQVLSSSRNIGVSLSPLRRTLIGAGVRSTSISLRQCSLSVRSIKISEDSRKPKAYAENGAFDVVSEFVSFSSFPLIANFCFRVSHVLFDSLYRKCLIRIQSDLLLF